MTENDLINMLHRAVADAGSQSAVARRIGYSPAAVSQVLSGKYGGDMATMLARVEEVYGSRQVLCPVLGAIALSRCAMERRTPFSASNPVRVRLFRACKTCSNNQG